MIKLFKSLQLIFPQQHYTLKKFITISILIILLHSKRIYIITIKLYIIDLLLF